MAFALTGYEALPVQTGGAQPRRAFQQVILHATGTTADVDLDIGADAGTFWTAAIANTTYGTMASNALISLQNVIAQAGGLRSVYCPQIDAAGERTGGSAGVVSFLSDASVGGAAAEVYAVPGLLATDTILGVTQEVDGTLGRPEIVTLLSAASAGGDASEAYTVTGLLTTDTVLSVTQEVDGTLGRPTIVVLSGTVATGSATPTAVVTGLLETDTILAVDQITVNANSLPLIGRADTVAVADALPLVYSADTGGSGTIAVTVQRAATADAYTPLSWGTQIANGLTVTYGADPGTGAQVRVTVQRDATADAYTPMSWDTQDDDLLTVNYGADPGTGAQVRVEVSRANGEAPVGSDYGLTFENNRPNWLFASSNGLLAYTIFLTYLIDPNILPVVNTMNVNS